MARVNGDVILAQEVFTPIRGRLAQAQQQYSPAEFAKFRTSEIQRQLRDLIERQLLIQAAKKQLPEPLIKRMEAMADKEFGKQIESEMKRMGVNTEAELRRKMLDEGESLDQLREFRRGYFIAQQYLRMQLQPRLDVSRDEMMEYYKRHRDQYVKEGGVRWSEILVATERHGSPEAARVRADQLLQQLRAGADFSELAKTESDGATASEGGRWGLTTQGSYAVAAVDAAIFKLPAGQLSGPLEGPKGWHIVRVEERVAAGVQSFTDVQEDIRQAIREQKVQKESQRYLQELVGKAHITTIFDQPNPPTKPVSNRK
ncbi:MAG: peptidyl-prolyl cis-trans isomerase [Planctomycetes bacterium]|nr:peptidyl-prolyl cis-trans isomerase [Planctomycetota bacterium]